MRHSAQKHNVARLRVFLETETTDQTQFEKLDQAQFAKLVGCSVYTLQSIEAGRLKLSEELARRISAATGVDFRWLIENDLTAEIITSTGAPYTRTHHDHAQSLKKRGEFDTFMAHLIEDYAASFYGQIRAMLSSAVKKELGEVAVWKMATFLEQCRDRFGHDKKLIPEPEQFGLRPDASPYLKHRQVEAGIALFREYDREREAIIAKAEAAAQKARRTRDIARPSKRRQRARRA